MSTNRTHVHFAKPKAKFVEDIIFNAYLFEENAELMQKFDAFLGIKREKKKHSYSLTK
jgi:hypothetical protein